MQLLPQVQEPRAALPDACVRACGAALPVQLHACRTCDQQGLVASACAWDTLGDPASLPPQLTPARRRLLPCSGAVGAAADLARGLRPWEDKGRDAPWVSFCLKMVALLRAANVTPIVSGCWVLPCAAASPWKYDAAGSHPTSLPPPARSTMQLVFDGGRLPAKAGTNQQRRARRQEAKERALRLLEEVRRCLCLTLYCCAHPGCLGLPCVHPDALVGVPHPSRADPVLRRAAAAQGRDAEAAQVFMQCVTVTAEMAQELIVRLR